MSKYRKIDPRIWNDAKFRDLSDSGKLVFFMLLTHPNMTALGAMRATQAGLAEELGWTAEGFRKAFNEVLIKGMAEHDKKACLVALPKFIRYNPPESPNVVKAWVGALDMLPECALKNAVITRAREFAEGMTKGFAEALPEVFAKTMPYQKQEQEQEQEITSSPAIAIPCLGGDHVVSHEDVSEYEAAYPAVDVMQQLRNMRQWVIANPAKRKTLSGVRRFITAWLAKDQNRGGSRNVAPSNDHKFAGCL